MASTIEEFVSKLQADGVQAGQAEADKIIAQAQKQAEQIVQQAKAEAEKIVSAAKKEADSSLAKSKTEMELAVRDAVKKLRRSIAAGIEVILAAPVQEPLQNSEFLSKLLHEMVMEYVKADIAHKPEIKINLKPEMHQKLVAWAIGEIRQAVEGKSARLDLKGNLRKAGFEFTIVGGATVEVSEDSVVAALAEMVGPRLREILDQAMKKAQ